VGAKIKWKATKRQKERKALAELKLLSDQNQWILLGFRPKLFIYKLAGTPKQKRISLLVKNKVGEAPVY
jgi:hypothetical protein